MTSVFGRRRAAGAASVGLRGDRSACSPGPGLQDVSDPEAGHDPARFRRLSDDDPTVPTTPSRRLPGDRGGARPGPSSDDRRPLGARELHPRRRRHGSLAVRRPDHARVLGGPRRRQQGRPPWPRRRRDRLRLGRRAGRRDDLHARCRPRSWATTRSSGRPSRRTRDVAGERSRSPWRRHHRRLHRPPPRPPRPPPSHGLAAPHPEPRACERRPDAGAERHAVGRRGRDRQRRRRRPPDHRRADRRRSRRRLSPHPPKPPDRHPDEPTWRTRLGAAAGAAVGLGLAVPASVAAHTLNATYESRLPLAVYLVGAATTVALSFVFVIVRDVRAAAPVVGTAGAPPARDRPRGLQAHRAASAGPGSSPRASPAARATATSPRSSCGSTAGSAWRSSRR